MEESGEKAESVVLRKLIDEALLARGKKSLGTTEAEPAAVEAATDSLTAVQRLLLNLVRQGETSLRIQDVSLALLQEVLGESRAGWKIAWDVLGAPGLSENGTSAVEVDREFEKQTGEAKNYAYGVADEIKRSQQ